MKQINQELISQKSRKGLIAGDTFSQTGSGQGRSSPENYNDLLSLMADSTFSSIVLQQTALLSQGNLMYEGSEARVKKVKELMKKLKEPKIRQQLFSNLLIYSNAFLEIVYKGKKPDSVAILETREMEIVDTPNGKVLGYVQENDKGSVSFLPNQVLHLKTFEITTDNWGYAYNKNLIRMVNHKMWVQEFLHWLFRTNQFRNIFSFEEAGDKINEFFAYLRQAENNPTRHLAIEGVFKNELLRNFNDGSNFMNLIAYYNSEIYRLMQQPPIVAGTVDNSNRSNSEAQLDSTYYSWMRYLRNNVYGYYLNYELLPMFGFDDVEVTMSPVDGKIDKTEVETIKGLQEMGLNDKGVEQELRKAGLEFSEGVKIEKPEIPMGTGGFGGVPPSRKPQDNFKDRKSGKESSTRPEQIGQKSKPDFNKYPYVYEVTG